MRRSSMAFKLRMLQKPSTLQYSYHYRADVKNVFFCGNFVSTPRVREFMTETFHFQNTKVKPVRNVLLFYM